MTHSLTHSLTLTLSLSFSRAEAAFGQVGAAVGVGEGISEDGIPRFAHEHHTDGNIELLHNSIIIIARAAHTHACPLLQCDQGHSGCHYYRNLMSSEYIRNQMITF